jgi:hypothetical protein
MVKHYTLQPQTLKILVIFSLLLLTLGNDVSYASEQEHTTETGNNLFLPLVYRGDIDLFVSDAKVIQGTTMSQDYQVFIANRDAVMRVFVGLEGGSKVKGVTGKLCGYDQAGFSMGCLLPDNTSINAPSFEATLKRTLNFRLPEDWVKPGYAYHVEIDPDHHIADGNPDNNRFPEQGIQPFNFVNATPLDVVVAPIEYKPYPSNQTFYPLIDDLSYLTPYPIKMLPIPAANYQTHASISYQPSQSEHNLDTRKGWQLLLNVITSVHDMEDPSGDSHYYGLVNSYDAHGCNDSCITGVANLGGKSAVGWTGFGEGTVEASKTLVHELGHNFGRKHVLCTGSEPDIDPNYPYPDGSIGQFGLDVQEGILYDPAIYKSFMSYCYDTWTSDYTYWNIYKYRKTSSGINRQSDIQGEAIYVRGILSPDGEATLLPVYRQSGQMAPPAAGQYSLDLLSASGEVLGTYPFEMYTVPDADGYRHFGFFVPETAGLDGLRLRIGDQILEEKIITAKFEPQMLAKDAPVIETAGERVIVRWPEVIHPTVPIYYRLRLSVDNGLTWQVLSLDWTEPRFLMPPGLGNSLVEVQASDGIHTTTNVYPLELAP